MNFKEFSNLLVEINERTILYHRSNTKLSPGDVLSAESAAPKEKDLQWKTNSFEICLEEFRKVNCPEKPSRFTAVFSSVVPRSLLVLNLGQLYEVLPIGRSHVTDGRFVTDIWDCWDKIYYNMLPGATFTSTLGGDVTSIQKKSAENHSRKNLETSVLRKLLRRVLDVIRGAVKVTWSSDANMHKLLKLMEDYWIPKKPFLPGDRKYLEVLSDAAKVVRVVDEKTPDLRPGDKFVLTSDITIKWLVGHSELDYDWPQIVRQIKKSNIVNVLREDPFVSFPKKNSVGVITFRKGFTGIISRVWLNPFTISRFNSEKYVVLTFVHPKVPKVEQELEFDLMYMLTNGRRSSRGRLVGDPVRSFLQVVR